MSDALLGERLRVRRALADDVDALVRLAGHPEVEPFLAPGRGQDAEQVRAAVARSEHEPHAVGLFVIEAETDGRSVTAGALAFELANARSRIVHLFGVMVDPAFHGRGLALEATRLVTGHLIRDLGWHRVQLECYAYNHRAVRLFERAGYVREGVRRRAYWRHGSWQDSVILGQIEEDLIG